MGDDIAARQLGHVDSLEIDGAAGARIDPVDGFAVSLEAPDSSLPAAGLDLDHVIDPADEGDEIRDEILGLTKDTINSRYRAMLVRQGDLWEHGVRLGLVMKKYANAKKIDKKDIENGIYYENFDDVKRVNPVFRLFFKTALHY